MKGSSWSFASRLPLASFGFLAIPLVALVTSGCASSAKQISETESTAGHVASSREMRGIYASANNAAVFQECGSTRKLPVSQNGPEFLFLEEHYRSVGQKPGEPAVATVTAHTERSGDRDVLIVEKVQAVTGGPGVNCDSR